MFWFFADTWQSDDGSGMDPEAMRHCMSFGFSDKKSKFAIGQCEDYDILYAKILVFSFIFIFQFGLADGNGFKTGSMRLGADAIVFSCHTNNMYGFVSHDFML